MRTGLKVFPVLDAGGLLAHLLTTAAFRRRTNELIARLEFASTEEPPVAPVPAIIQSFAWRAVYGNRVPDTVWLSQRGEMHASRRGPWRRFAAEQVISIREPGFAWRARLQMAPLVSAQILDCYVNGAGLLEARLFGSLPVARAAGPEASRGELMRYLGELAWAPHATLHNPQLSWREIDASTIGVSATSPAPAGPTRVRLIFEDGDITRIEAYDRPRAAGRRLLPTRWEGRCCDYREIGGCRIPTRAAVSWLLEDGPFEYWRASVKEFGMK